MNQKQRAIAAKLDAQEWKLLSPLNIGGVLAILGLLHALNFLQG